MYNVVMYCTMQWNVILCCVMSQDPTEKHAGEVGILKKNYYYSMFAMKYKIIAEYQYGVAL